MLRFFFRLGGGDSLGYKSVIYFIFQIEPGVVVGVGVSAGVGVDQKSGIGVGVGVGTAPTRLRTPA